MGAMELILTAENLTARKCTLENLNNEGDPIRFSVRLAPEALQ